MKSVPVIYTDDEWSVVKLLDSAVVVIPFTDDEKYARRKNKFVICYVEAGVLNFTCALEILTTGIRNWCVEYFTGQGLLPVVQR